MGYDAYLVEEESIFFPLKSASMDQIPPELQNRINHPLNFVKPDKFHPWAVLERIEGGFLIKDADWAGNH